MPTPFVLVDTDLAAATAGASVALDEDAEHHLNRVLRLRPGAELELGDGRGRTAPGRLTGAAVELMADPVHTTPPRPRLHVLQSLAKGRKVDEVVRSLTELGVDAVTLVSSARSVVRLEGGKAAKAQRRWQAVARAACEQSRRPWMPTVSGPVPLSEVLERLPRGRNGLVADVEASTPLAHAVRDGWDGEEVLAAIGPEGGWTEEEVAACRAAGLQPVSLGHTVLRTEHAGMVVAAVLAYETGRLD